MLFVTSSSFLAGPLACSGDPLTYPVIAKRGAAKSRGTRTASMHRLLCFLFQQGPGRLGFTLNFPWPRGAQGTDHLIRGNPPAWEPQGFRELRPYESSSVLGTFSSLWNRPSTATAQAGCGDGGQQHTNILLSVCQTLTSAPLPSHPGAEKSCFYLLPLFFFNLNSSTHL